MTRHDYETLQEALGSSLANIKALVRESDKQELSGAAEASFWYTVETVSEYLMNDNKAFRSDYFLDEIYRHADEQQLKNNV